MRLVVVLLFIIASAASADPPPEVIALQKHLHEVIDKAESSVACILVSRSEHYTDFNQGPSAARDGKLGEFRPPPANRFVNAAQLELVKRLDLARAENVPESYASGVVIDEKGLILTNYHVIGDVDQKDEARIVATKIFVRLNGTGRGSYADILAADPRTDLAVLQMIRPPANLRAIPIGNGGMVRKGDWVVALANPFAAGFRDGSSSASWGIISNLRRRVAAPTKEFERVRPFAQYGSLLQTDARLNLGCSGGALLNMDGELIGLTTAQAAITGGEGAGGYAIPMNANTTRMIKILMRGEEIEYGLLGVTVNPEERGDGTGVMIQDVSPGMPAIRAGLQSRDVVISINGNPVREQDDLFLNISAALAGNEVEIDVMRGNRRTRVKARLAKAPSVGKLAEAVIAPNRPGPIFGLRVDYASTLSPGSNPPEGVLVKELEPGSPAAKKLGEWASKSTLIVTAVNGEAVSTPADFRRLAGGKSSITLDVEEFSPEGTRKKVILP
jgi:serine protease Do